MEGSSIVTPETFAACADLSETWRQEQIADSKAGKRTAYRVAAALGVVAVACAGALAFKVVTDTPKGWIMSCDSSAGRCAVVTRLDRTILPPYVNDWFLGHYVELRESFDEVGYGHDGGAFDAVACMSAPEEQKRYEAWFDGSPEAPSQKLTKNRAHGFRVATAVSDPVTIGTGKDEARRIQVRYEFYDQGGAVKTPAPSQATATFTVRKGVRTPCNPTGQYVTDYRADVDHAR